MVYSVDTVDTVMTATNIAVIAHGLWEHTTLTVMTSIPHAVQLININNDNPY